MKQGKLNYPSEYTKGDTTDTTDARPVCKYGSKCYRKNPEHQKQYKHTRDCDEVVSLPPASLKKVKVTENSDSEELSLSVLSEGDQADKDKPDIQNDELVPPKIVEDSPKKKETIYEKLLVSDDVITMVKKRFFIELSKTCLKFWDFCIATNAKSPCSALKELGLELVGPFEVLDAVNKGLSVDEIYVNCMSCRYYFDPPEVLTVMEADKLKGSHIGYYTDHPLTQPNFMVLCPSKGNCGIKPIGDNLFQAVLSLQQNKDSELIKSLKEFATDNGVSLDAHAFKLRKKKVVADTFHGAGIVVPYDRATELGYRPLHKTNTELKTLLSQITTATESKKRSLKQDELQELITFVQFANDEGDPGMGLELGIDLFCNGNKLFTSQIFHLLTVAYDLLGRQPYRWIIEEHLSKRKEQ